MFKEVGRFDESVPALPRNRNVMPTKKRSVRLERSTSDDMRPEYDFSKARPNRFAKHFTGRGQGGLLVFLESDVAQVFDSGEKVNQFLRATLAAVHK